MSPLSFWTRRKNAPEMSQKSGSEIRIRNHVEFDWNGTSESTPPGREIAVLMRVALSTDVDMLYPLSEQSDGDWEFKVWPDGPKLLIIVRQTHDWLVILRPLPSGIFFNSWQSPLELATGLLTAGQAIHEFLVSDSAFSGVQWYTPEEYAERLVEGLGGPSVGSSVPGRA